MLLELLNLLEEFGEAVGVGFEFHGLAQRSSMGGAAIHLARGAVFGDASLGSDGGAVADVDVADEASLTGDGDVVTTTHAA